MLKTHNIILASGSQARQSMLKNAGIDFEVQKTDIDERQLEAQNAHLPPDELVQLLADHKALSVSEDYKSAIVIGSDQILVVDNKIYSKAKTDEEALQRLNDFQGKTHRLISAVSVALYGQVIWRYTDYADLTMREMTKTAITNYIASAGGIVTQCVGCYAIEGLGIKLFREVNGDYFTILGMPFLPLVNYLMDKGYTQ